jgi:DNA polymerase
MNSRHARYLDAMGIQLWQRRDALPAVEEAQTEVASAQPVVPVQNAHSEDAEIALLDWRDLQARVAQCPRCPELVENRTQTVFGVGNHNADWLVIGEAPGADEDVQGEPFVGRAGQLLNAMLLAIGLKRDEVFIANILKCRPPNNRDPKPEEAANCAPYLQRQIALIQPKIILAVGRIAAQNLLQTDTPIGKLRGQLYNYRDIPLVVTYHPAYLLRTPSDKRKAWEDLKLARSLVASS